MSRTSPWQGQDCAVLHATPHDPATCSVCCPYIDAAPYRRGVERAGLDVATLPLTSAGELGPETKAGRDGYDQDDDQ